MTFSTHPVFPTGPGVSRGARSVNDNSGAEQGRAVRDRCYRSGFAASRESVSPDAPWPLKTNTASAVSGTAIRSAPNANNTGSRTGIARAMRRAYARHCGHCLVVAVKVISYESPDPARRRVRTVRTLTGR
jgi:hypothetical protein